MILEMYAIEGRGKHKVRRPK